MVCAFAASETMAAIAREGWQERRGRLMAVQPHGGRTAAAIRAWSIHAQSSSMQSKKRVVCITTKRGASGRAAHGKYRCAASVTSLEEEGEKAEREDGLV
jgi:hypothetical protein